MNTENSSIVNFISKKNEFKFFKQLSVDSIINILPGKPAIDKIINVDIVVEIMDATNIIPTASNTLTEKSILIHCKTMTRIEYLTSSSTSPILMEKFISYFSVHFPIDNTQNFIHANSFQVHVENKHLSIIEGNKIYLNMLVLITPFSQAFINKYKQELIFDTNTDIDQDFIKKFSTYNNTTFLATHHFYDTIEISDSQPDIQEIIKAIAEVDIVDYKIISTIRGRSFEGQYLSGKMLMVKFMVRHNILYADNKSHPSVYSVPSNLVKVSYIVVPDFMSNNVVNSLIANGIMELKGENYSSIASKVSKTQISVNSHLHINFSHLKNII